MQGLSSASNRAIALLAVLLVAATGCSRNSSDSVRTVPIQQSWELQPGKMVGGHRIAGGLGDISIEMGGDRVYAPFDGELQPNDVEQCYIFSSPQLPAYLFRLCGLKSAQVGAMQQGDTLGSADYLQFATLRRQPDGKWAIVEPASDILERILKRQ